MKFEPRFARFLVRKLMIRSDHDGLTLDRSPVGIARRSRRRMPVFRVSIAQLEPCVGIEDVILADPALKGPPCPINVDVDPGEFVSAHQIIAIPWVGLASFARRAWSLVGCGRHRRRKQRNTECYRTDPPHTEEAIEIGRHPQPALFRKFGAFARLEPMAEIAADQFAELVDLALEMGLDFTLHSQRDGIFVLGRPVPAQEALSK